MNKKIQVCCGWRSYEAVRRGKMLINQMEDFQATEQGIEPNEVSTASSIYSWQNGWIPIARVLQRYTIIVASIRSPFRN